MWFESEEEIARKEELEKMEEKVMFEHTVKTELKSPGSTHVPFFSNPEKAQVLERAIKTASDIRSRTRDESSESIGTWSADEESSGGEREKESTKGRGGWIWAMVLTVIIFAIASMKDTEEGGRQYAASYDFSKIAERATSRTITLPENKWVLVELPVHYRVTLSSATAKGAELDKLDGSKPILFSQKEFGELPLAIAIKNSKECEMTISFVRL